MQKLFTGLQPSGSLHIGNYFGALKPAVEMCKAYNGMLMIADYHALTTLKDPRAMRENIMSVVKDYLAAGLDPTRTTIFKQSDVPEHTELSWIFQCLVTTAFLELSHAYKDKVAKGLEANAGLFAYPILMAADILLYDTDVVPVGEDQRQHLEYARETAAKFNNTFGQTFKEPKEMIIESVAVIPGTDGRKMSKSYNNIIPLFGSKDEIAKAVMSIVTDSKGKRPENVFAIHRAFKREEEIAPLYERSKSNYKAIKEALIEDIEALIGPMRAKRDSISDDDARRVLEGGGERARKRASKKMLDVREKIGVTI
ncbi:tryptophan--tRNA ligase [Candidatus Kaiserbacteria bacterium]|nr:tryptophan--tRNA ligase [Candidatus Kaiserbacteria bacterium]